MDVRLLLRKQLVHGSGSSCDKRILIRLLGLVLALLGGRQQTVVVRLTILAFRSPQARCSVPAVVPVS